VLWNPAQSWVFQNAVDKNLPIVLYFVEADDDETRLTVSGQKVAEYSTDKAMFVIVPKPAAEKVAEVKDGPTVTGGGKSVKESEAKAETGISPVPVNKLLAADLWKAYGVDKAKTMIVADWFGNSQTVYASAPKEGVITKAIDVVPDTMKQAEAKADKELTKVESALEKANDAAALRSALKIFKMDVVGFASVTKAVEKYGQIINRGRDQMKNIEATGDVTALRKLKSTFRGTELDVEIENAVARVTATTSK
jgi:hypothetical protein